MHYGDPAPTRRCLDSLTGIDEIVLVDQPPQRFGDDPRLTVRIAPDENIGFAAGCNRGVADTDAPFVLLLNNDAFLAAGALDAIRSAMAAFPADVAGACLKILCTDVRTIQSAGGLWFTRDCIGFPHGFGDIDRGQYDSLGDDEIGVPSGAGAVFRTSAWRDVGGMREEFFCYCEDGDVGLRLVACGYRFAWLPSAIVLHELSSSTAAHSQLKAYLVERNHFATMIHVATASTLAAFPFWTLARLARTGMDALRGRGAGAAFAQTSRPVALAKVIARAWLGALRMAPGAASVRRELRRRSPQAIERVRRFVEARRVLWPDFAMSRDSGRH